MISPPICASSRRDAAAFVFEFTRYEPLPLNLEPKVIEEAKKFIDMKDDEGVTSQYQRKTATGGR